MDAWKASTAKAKAALLRSLVRQVAAEQQRQQKGRPDPPDAPSSLDKDTAPFS